MKLLSLIFIIAYLTEQLKADVYTVEVGFVVGGNESLATLHPNDGDILIITFLSDIDQENVKLLVVFFDNSWNEIDDIQLNDPCNMDPSTEEGTLAAILWGTFGIDSCPIAAGDYVTVPKFIQTGIIENRWEDINEGFIIGFRPLSPEDESYFTFFTPMHLVDGKPSK